MKKYKLEISFIMLFSLLSAILLQPTEAMGKWVSNTTHAPYRIDHVCIDGVQVTATVNDIIEGDSGEKVTLDVHLFEGEYADDWLTNYHFSLQDEYLTPIGYSMFFDANIAQTEPITGFFNTQTISYTTQIMPFIIEPSVGSTVLVENSGPGLSVNNFSTVDNCRFFDYTADQSHSFESTSLVSPSASLLNTNALVFKVEELPDSGEVSLNGNIPLADGSQFTHKDLLDGGGQLEYVSVNNSNSTQIIRFSVTGTDRLTNANFDSYRPSISGDGSYVSFTSDATDLTSLSTGGFSHVYRANLLTGSIDPISLNPDQTEFGNGSSDNSVISPTGSRIAYSSLATTLIDVNNGWCLRRADTNLTKDVFLWRNNFSTQERISTFANSGVCQESPLISDYPAIADERALSYDTAHQTFSQLPYDNYEDNNGELDVIAFDGSYNEHIYDTANNTPIIIIPTIIVPTVVPTLPPIIIPREGEQALAAPQATPQAPNAPSLDPDISADGNVIVYESFATDLIRTISGNPADTNGLVDIYASIRNEADDGWFVRRISVNSDNQQASGGDSRNPTVSMFGNHVAFQSKASNFDPAATTGNWQIFVRDLEVSCTTLLSTHTDGTLGNGDSTDPSISGDGRFIAFTSVANNLVDADTNGYTDIFVVDRDANNTGSFYSDPETCTPSPSRTFRVSVSADGTQGDDDSYQPDISLNGEFVAFTSDATVLAPDDLNGYSDIFVHYIGYTREIALSPSGSTNSIYLPMVLAP